jgi:hypothetical protein
MAKNFEKLIFGGLHEKHAVKRGIWVPTQHLLWDQGKPRGMIQERVKSIYKGGGGSERHYHAHGGWHDVLHYCTCSLRHGLCRKHNSAVCLQSAA